MTEGIDHEADWGKNPVALTAPVLHQGVYSTGTRGSEFRVKSRELSIVIGCETVDCGGPQLASTNWKTDGFRDESSLSTNLLSWPAFSFSDLGIHCDLRDISRAKQIWNSDNATDWGWALDLPMDTILAALWLSVKTFNCYSAIQIF